MNLNRTLNSLAEGGGNLSQRLPRSERRGDETTVMAQWINSFIDNLEQIIHGVIRTTHGIDTTNAALRQRSDETCEASRRMVDDMGVALGSIRRQVAEIDGAGSEVEAMRSAVHASNEASREQFELVKSRSDSIRQSVGLATRTIRDLEASAQEIGRIVIVIDDIAKQTNLLALNAAIEAARAGAEGRGFAVVADEVRKLAERTAKSTREITTMVGAVQSRAEEAVITMDTGMSDLEDGLQLATAAATDKKDVQEILQRLFATIDQLAAASHDNSARVESIAQSAHAVRHAVGEASESAVLTSNAAKALDQLVGQFTVSNTRG
jgi:methyl-accepting chemotaxis protein